MLLFLAGTPLDRYNVRREFHNITEKAGLGRGRPPASLGTVSCRAKR
jgi:hypothetical protein